LILKDCTFLQYPITSPSWKVGQHNAPFLEEHKIVCLGDHREERKFETDLLSAAETIADGVASYGKFAFPALSSQMEKETNKGSNNR
jgi:hypothetical protein